MAPATNLLFPIREVGIALLAAERAFAARPAMAAFVVSVRSQACLNQLETIRPFLRADLYDEVEEAGAYFQEALDYGDWSAASIDLARLLSGIDRILVPSGLEPLSLNVWDRLRTPQFRIARLTAALPRLNASKRLWIRLELALMAIRRQQRRPTIRPSTLNIRGFRNEYLSLCRPRSVDTVRHVYELFEEAIELEEYIDAELDAGAHGAFRIDLDRLDSVVRALRFHFQRESAQYFPLPGWQLRMFGGVVRRSLTKVASFDSAEVLAQLEKLSTDGALDGGLNGGETGKVA